MDRPLLIISPGRSGSSYTAGQFAKAGLFTGICRSGDKWNEGGYFENIKLHRGLRDWYGSDWPDGEFPEEKGNWRDFVADVLYGEGYSGGPWLFKFGAFYWKTFESFDPIYVKVWRDREKILKSFRRCGMLARFSEGEITRIVDRQHEAMRHIDGLDVHI